LIHQVLYALIALLVISIITVVATATLTGSSESTSPAGVVQPGDLGPDMVDVQQRPSQSPLSMVWSNSSPSFNSSTAAAVSTEPVATLSPSASMVTLQTTPPFSTQPPATFFVGAFSTLPPTTTPPLASPTSLPSSPSPSLSLNGLATSFRETFRFDHGGSFVVISQNARVMAVSDFNLVKIYELDNDNSVWNERDSIPAGDGTRVVLNTDGSVVAVSVPRDTALGGQLFSGIVRVYLYDVFVGYRLLGQELDIGSTNALFGTGLALSLTGRTIAVGGPFFSSTTQSRVGQVRVYRYSTAQNQWLLLGDPLFGTDAQDWFGSTVAIVEDLVTLVAVSAPHSATKSGFIQTYVLRDDEEWVQYGGSFSINNSDASTLLPSAITDGFGNSMSLVQTETGYRMAVGALQKEGPNRLENSGMVVVYEYDRQLDQWAILGEPVVGEAGDRLGSAVTLLNGGNLLVVGSQGYFDSRGAIRFYRFDGAGKFVSSDGGFLEGLQAGELFGSSFSGTMVNNGLGSVISLAVSANKRTEVSLLQQIVYR
jgi:hypothetical protein